MSLDCVRRSHEQALSGACVSELITAAQVTVRVRTWTGRVGDGTFTDSDLVLPKRYPVKELSTREIASSGGRYEMGDVRVTDITKSFTGGGYTKAQLSPASEWDSNEDSREELYILTGDISGTYKLKDLEGDDVVSWSMVLGRTLYDP